MTRLTETVLPCSKEAFQCRRSSSRSTPPLACRRICNSCIRSSTHSVSGLSNSAINCPGSKMWSPRWRSIQTRWPRPTASWRQRASPSGGPARARSSSPTLSQVALPELIGLRRSLLGWLATADTAGLDEDGIVALFTSVLRDFRERQGGSGSRPGAAERCFGRRGMNVIEATGLGKRYGNTWALRECSMAIPDGHVVALVGPNGAGKTTLLNLAVGLTTPTRWHGYGARGHAGRVASRARWHRVRRPGCTAAQVPVRRRHAAPHPEPEPALRSGLCRSSTG